MQMDDEEKKRHYELANKVMSEQNFIAQLIVEAAATVLSAGAYGIIVAKWAFSYGFAVTDIGIVVGLSMRYLGRGIQAKFGVAAAVYSLAGCVFGNFCRAIAVLPSTKTGH
jgi:hypothetical protein